MLRRHLAPILLECLKSSRIVNLVGPRQTGKSTLVQTQIPIAAYMTMDTDPVRSALQSDAYGHLRETANRHRNSRLPIVLDEIQRVPEATLVLKRIVDEDNLKGQFLLTGSADVFTLTNAKDSLAGRVHTLVLRPLSAAEIYETGPCRLLDLVETDPESVMANLPQSKTFSRSEAIDLILRGGFPEIRTLDDRHRNGRYNSYIDSIIIKDVPVVSPVRKPDSLRRLVDQLAVRTAQELNMSNLCNAVGARQETVSAWLDTLERLCMINRLPSWASSGVKKAVHWPKVHFLDTGCAAALRNESQRNFDLDADPTSLGPLLESYIHQEIEKSLAFTKSIWTLSHWRSDRAEIDLIAEGPGRRLALIESKASATITQSDFKSIDWFLTKGPGQNYAPKSVGFVIYLGKDVLTFGPGRIALPLSTLWSFASQL